MKRDSTQSRLRMTLLAIVVLLLLLLAGAWWGIGQGSSVQTNADGRVGPMAKLAQWVEPPPPPIFWITDGISNTVNLQWSVQLNNPYTGSFTSDLRTWQLRTSTNYALVDGTSITITIGTTPIGPAAPANTGQ